MAVEFTPPPIAAAIILEQNLDAPDNQLIEFCTFCGSVGVIHYEDGAAEDYIDHQCPRCQASISAPCAYSRWNKTRRERLEGSPARPYSFSCP